MNHIVENVLLRLLNMIKDIVDNLFIEDNLVVSKSY